MPSDANKPRFAFPYRRVPCLWHTPVSGFPHTIPASFVCEVCCFTEPEDAAVDLFLTEMRAHGNRGALNSGMMAKKAGEVNMAEGQIGRGPDLLATGTGSFRPEGWSEHDSSKTIGLRRSVSSRQSPATALRGDSTDSASPRRTGPRTNAGTSRSGARERLVARRGNSVR